MIFRVALDIGAGTSDLMVCQYSHYGRLGVRNMQARALFYDGFYYAGDDMMFEVARKVLLRRPMVPAVLSPPGEEV